eukprot:CAMPEP_0167751636 /NCGR_PEP_ID=MMETSP0110_2-20121227/6691_1 /TAXON_ID=629695 /ORGANISM="Gymnochlora sp., Strain CCMP2014" /LENGTH=383 /DNA_ID=CAMNT_0007637159 /DNA_START=1556 /DNA_END=2707 /DNA_ORIENTATION=+
MKDGEVKSLENIIKTHVSDAEDRSEMERILYGGNHTELDVGTAAKEKANAIGIDFKAYKVPAAAEQTRSPRLVRLAAIQNKIVVPTSAPIIEQRDAIFRRIEQIVEVAALAGANVVCLQECWTGPFFFCTREKQPWMEFAESAQHGESFQLISELAKRHRMVIVSPILERDDKRSTIWNTAVVVDQTGRYMGKHRKNHIPRVGDFNESTYYMEGDTGHPVFDTIYGKIAVNICYGRHHPLNWMMFGLNGAEVVFNPSATVGKLSEPLWGIEARNAAIANHYFSVGINRVGTEEFPNQFTSGDGAPAKTKFGHFYGSSYIAAPDGYRTPGLSRVDDGLLITEVDLNMCQQVRDKWLFNQTARFDMYAESLEEYIDEEFEPQIIR